MDSIWWNQVTNAVRYVSDIVESLLDEKSILIKYSGTLPWIDQFKYSVEEQVKNQNAEKTLVFVENVKNPGEYLLNEFCKKERRAEYRPSKGYARFFAENDDTVLHDRYVWIKSEEIEYLENWLSFVSEYTKERDKKNKAVFILEWSGNCQITVKKGVKSFQFDEYVGEYDRLAFAVMSVSGLKEPVYIKNYVAELSANISGNDIELCDECIKGYKEFLENPGSFIKTVVEERLRSNGSQFIFDKNDEEVEQLIWLSQIKTIYPLLEEYRGDFVKRYANRIAPLLPIPTTYGHEYTDPKEVELGTLMFLADDKQLILDRTDYNRLYNYKEARNDLSHLKTLSLCRIKALMPE